ncbi:zinc metalloprotease [Rhodothermaceae bacterium RA]|nr:zinc metalloprotease [Rhodothermaceae bacterium RA]
MEFDYDIVYSDRKTIQITVERDRSVVVRAPRSASAEQIDRAVQSKRFWIYGKLRHPQKYAPEWTSKTEFVSGASILYLGRHYPLEIVDEVFEGVRFDHRFYLSRRSQPQAAALFKVWFKERARQKITPLVEEMAERLGVTYNRIMISDLRYQWGSCTPNDNLNFNWRIIKAPMSVVKYVVVHELAHLIEPNHTPRFWNIVHVQVPRYEKARTWLRTYGHELQDGP